MDEHLAIITTRAELAARPAGRAACVLVDPRDDALLDALAPALPQQHLVRMALSSRRPLAHVDDDHVAVLTLVPDGWDALRRGYLAAHGDLLVVVGDERTHEIARTAVGIAPASPALALAKVLAGIGHAAEEDLDRMSDSQAVTDVDLSGRLVPVAERREVSRRRTRLSEWRQLYAGQAHLLGPDEPLAEALGEESRRTLRPACGSFQYAAGVADRIYAVLGDVLSEQDALASQRLTLVSTVFLPLTVTTGFFGMNFGWMTDRIGSAGAFGLLGVLVPVLAVAATLAVVRRYGG